MKQNAHPRDPARSRRRHAPRLRQAPLRVVASGGPTRPWARVPAIWRFGLLAALLVLLGLTERSAERYFTAGVSYGTSALQPVPNVPFDRYGINTFLDQDVYDAQLQRDFAAIQAGGFGWVRQEFICAMHEPDHAGYVQRTRYVPGNRFHGCRRQGIGSNR